MSSAQMNRPVESRRVASFSTSSPASSRPPCRSVTVMAPAPRTRRTSSGEIATYPCPCQGDAQQAPHVRQSSWAGSVTTASGLRSRRGTTTGIGRSSGFDLHPLLQRGAAGVFLVSDAKLIRALGHPTTRKANGGHAISRKMREVRGGQRDRCAKIDFKFLPLPTRFIEEGAMEFLWRELTVDPRFHTLASTTDTPLSSPVALRVTLRGDQQRFRPAGRVDRTPSTQTLPPIEVANPAASEAFAAFVQFGLARMNDWSLTSAINDEFERNSSMVDQIMENHRTGGLLAVAAFVVS